MNSCTHATTSQWQFKQRDLPDPSLYRQPSDTKSQASEDDTKSSASKLDVVSESEPDEACSKPVKRVVSLDLLRPQPMSPPANQRRRSLSALFHRHT